LGKAPINFGMSVGLSVRLQLEGFSLNLTLYTKTYILSHLWQQNEALCISITM